MAELQSIAMVIPIRHILVHSVPSHSPETNAIETVWQHLKPGLRWQLPKTLDDLRLISNRLAEMT